MTHLRQIMLEELQRRNFAESTIRCYIRAVEQFSLYFHRRPDRLGPEHIRHYQAALLAQKLAPNSVGQQLAALRFFYIRVLHRHWSIAETPYPKRAFRLPLVLSQEEVTRLIDAAETPFHGVLLMTLYATGARRAEARRNIFLQIMKSMAMVTKCIGRSMIGRSPARVVITVTPEMSTKYFLIHPR